MTFTFIKKKEAEILLSKDISYTDDHGKTFSGLKEYELIIKNDKAIYIFDNHNIALLPFLEVSKKKKMVLEIVHIDAHRDDSIFEHPYPKKITLENLDWCIQKTRVSDYLDIATQAGLIGKIHNITQSWEFENFVLPNNDFILNLDIDIFGEDGEMVDYVLKRAIIKKAWAKATAVCIATSPGFINQEKAKKIILELLRE